MLQECTYRKPKGRGEGRGRGEEGEGRGGRVPHFAKEIGPHRLLSGNQREEGRKQMGTVRVGAKVREPQPPREPHE